MPRKTLVGEIQIIARRLGGAYARGRWVSAPGDPFPFFATVNPVPGDVLATLEEGERLGRQYRVLSTDTSLFPPDEETGRAGDEVYYEGAWFEVRDRQVYPTVIPHAEYRVRRRTPARPPSP
jgi:hypothetical protein